MLSCFQGNATIFNDRVTLPEKIAQKIGENMVKGIWRNYWKNNVSLHTSSKVYGGKIYANAHAGIGGPLVSHFFIEARNQHWCKHAQNCAVYLEGITNLKSGAEIPVEVTEFKWSGSTNPSVLIPASSSRRIDAFQIDPRKPDRLGFKIFSDSTEFLPNVPIAGIYQFTFEVQSSNFPTARKAFLVKTQGTADSISITEA